MGWVAEKVEDSTDWVEEQVEDAVDFVTEDIPEFVEEEIFDPVGDFLSNVGDALGDVVDIVDDAIQNPYIRAVASFVYPPAAPYLNAYAKLDSGEELTAGDLVSLGVSSVSDLGGITIDPEIAKAMDLDPDKVTNNMDEAMLQAELLKGFQGPPQAGGAPQQGQPPAGANPLDPTGAGGGTIGTGQAPVPGEQGFSGNDGQAGAAANQAASEQPQATEQLQ